MADQADVMEAGPLTAGQVGAAGGCLLRVALKPHLRAGLVQALIGLQLCVGLDCKSASATPASPAHLQHFPLPAPLVGGLPGSVCHSCGPVGLG